MAQTPKLFLIACITIASLLATPYAIANDSRELKVDEQPLSDALKTIANEFGVDIAFFPEATDGLDGIALVGSYTSGEAFDALLEDTELEYQALDNGTVVVRAKNQGGNSDSKNSSPTPILIAQNQTSQPQSTTSSRSDEQQQDGQDIEEERDTRGQLEQIVVIGTRNTGIRRYEDDAQPYVVFDQEVIERSSSANLEDFFVRNLPSVSTASVSTNSDDASGNTSSISLRGLGDNETLILVDGRRLAGFRTSGDPSQPDINTIPLAAIERIEVLPATASGIYGAGATAGVINIILRRDYRGLDIAFAYEDVLNGSFPLLRGDINGGATFNDGKTRVNFSASHSDATGALSAGERDYIERRRNSILSDDPDSLFSTSTPPLGFTTNIRSRSGDLVLDDGTPLGAAFTFVPAGYVGVASDGGVALVQNAGQYNLDLANTVQVDGARKSIRTAPRVSSFRGSIEQDITDNLRVFVEGATSVNESKFTRLSNSLDGVFELAADDPANPFQQDVRVTVPILGAEQTTSTQFETHRLSAGFIFDVSETWTIGSDFTWDESKSRLIEDASLFAIDKDAAEAAVSSGQIDVFSDVNEFDLNVGQFIVPNRFGSARPAKTALYSTALRASGRLPFELPGGRLVFSSVAEYRAERFGERRSQSPSFDGGFQFTLVPSAEQTSFSIYSEILFPIVSPSTGVSGVHRLELQTAFRHEEFKVDGATQSVFTDEEGTPEQDIVRATREDSSTNPTVAIRYAPTEAVMFRGSYATGFLPPTVIQVTRNSEEGQFVPDQFWELLGPRFGITGDPLRGGEIFGSVNGLNGIFILNGGNPDLDPEESVSYAAGLVLTPRWLPGLRLSADWVRIEKTNAIESIGGLTRGDTYDLLFEFAPERATRGPVNPSDGFDVGPITALDLSLINFAEQTIESIDISADYTFETEWFGDFAINAESSHFITNERRLNPGAPLDDFVSLAGALDWRANGRITWFFNAWTVSWATQYYSEHKVRLDSDDTIDVQIFHDLSINYQFDENTDVLGGALRDTKITLAVNNVFDTAPAEISFGDFYSGFGDPRQARYHIGIRKSF